MIPLLLVLGCMHPRLEALPLDARPDSLLDRGPHETAQTEWWHVHATLAEVEGGEPLHVFAAFVVQRPRLDRVAGLPAGWGPRDVHLALVQLQQGQQTWQADRCSIPDLWTAAARPEGLRHGDWTWAWEGDALVVHLSAGPHDLSLTLAPTGEPALPGEGGRAEIPPGCAHLWVQHERMEATARLETGKEVRWLEGTGSAKHQWGRLYDPHLDGFEWFSLDLDEEHSLSVAWVLDGSVRGAPGSSAWLSDAGGHVLPVEVHRVVPLETWHSRRTGADWPVAWHLEGPSLDLVVKTELPDQELWGPPAAVHVGPATATGEILGMPWEGSVFVEQVGAHLPRSRILYTSDPPWEAP